MRHIPTKRKKERKKEKKKKPGGGATVATVYMTPNHRVLAQMKAFELVPGILHPCSNSMWFFARDHSINYCSLGEMRFPTPEPAKFKHVKNIVTCTLPWLLCFDWITYVPALWNFQKADFEFYQQKIHHFFFSKTWGSRLKYLSLRDVPTCSCIQLYT